jgi:hypothetical protein
MLYGVLIVGLQIACAVHCLRHKYVTRNWLWLILFFPLIGSLIYLLVEIFPHWGKPRSGNPNPLRYRETEAELAQERSEFRKVGSIRSHEQAAELALQQGQPREAILHYRACLSGPCENDPELLYKLAEAAFAADDVAQALEALHRIRALSDYAPAKVRLLLARVYTAQADYAKAEPHFEYLLAQHPSPDVRYYWARFLHLQGQVGAAQTLLSELLAAYPIGSTAPPWLNEAQQMARELKQK